MKLAIVMMFSNELPWLKLHLPVFASSFDGIVSITDPKTTDGSYEYVREISEIDPLIRTWTYNWGEFATAVCNYAEAMGFDAVMRLDPDECLMPDAGHEIKRLLTNDATLLVFPRHEFFGDRLHVRADIYPDSQARAWRLNRGIVVGGLRHEGVNFSQHGLSEHSDNPDTKVLRLRNIHIYHYGWASNAGIRDNQIKYQSHAQVSAGGPPEVAPTFDPPLASFPTVEFNDPQPLNQKLIGSYAPYTE